MTLPARVLVVDADAARGQRLARSLAGGRYAVETGTAGAPVLSRLEAADAPDIVLLGERLDDMSGLDCARRLRADRRAAAAATILLGTPDLDPAAMTDTIDDLVGEPFTDAELQQRLSAALRLKMMRDELAHRGETLKAYGISGRLPGLDAVDGAHPHVLVVGERASAAEDAASLLEGHGLLTRAASAADALDALAGNRGIELVAIAATEATAGLDLIDMLRDDPRRFHLPIAVIAAPDLWPDPAEPIHHGASDVIFTPLKAQDLRVRLSALVRHERLRLKIAAGYRDAAQLSGRDSLTGLYTHGFLHDHLIRLLAARGRPGGHGVCIAFFDVEGMGEINLRYGYAAGDALLSRLGTIVSRTVRAEDLPARHDGQSFCVILPGTTPRAASTVLERVCSIVAFTEFALPGINRPVRAHLQATVAEAGVDETAEGLIARARAAARGHRAAA